MARGSGVLLPVSSLPGEYGIGSFGAEARRFVDFLAACGFTYWQVLPLCMTNRFHSPYQSPAAFSLNPLLIDLEALPLTEAELSEAKQETPYVCEYARLEAERMPLLRRAYARADVSETDRVLAEYPELAETCRFLALRDANGGKAWQEWTETEGCDEGFYRFLQATALLQWLELRQYANAHGVRLIGDLPIYTDGDSADVWAHREQFLLDERGYPTLVAGVPPDLFSADGQLWGNPIYDWNAMKEDGYLWWRRRMAFSMTLYDGVRIDHFRGLESYWGVPFGAETAREGQWYPGPGLPFCRVLREVAGDGLIIAEDLGEITDAVRKLVEDSGFWGMRVLQFAFLSESESWHHPHNYFAHTVAYSGTHDNNTLLGFLWELPEELRTRALRYCGSGAEDWRRGCGKMIDTLYASAAELVITPIQDLLAYGSDTRLNRPGLAAGNWEYRVTWAQLAELSQERLLERNRDYFRI